MPSAEANARVDELIEAILTAEQPPLTIYLSGVDAIDTALRLGMKPAPMLVWHSPESCALSHLFRVTGRAPYGGISLCGFVSEAQAVGSSHSPYWPRLPGDPADTCSLCAEAARQLEVEGNHA